MKSERTRAGWWLVGALCTAIVAIGCGGGSAKKNDAGDGSPDSLDGPVVGGDGGVKTDGPNGSCPGVDAPRANGETCTCGGQCSSGFCAPEGVCCNEACAGACKSCSVPEKVGQCLSRPAGDPPRTASACPKSAPASCGLDGTCDGAGSCRKYGNDTQCMTGRCEGDQVVGSYACNGAGQCKPGATKICAPFSCNSGGASCFAQCTTDAQCVSGHKCVNGSCGLKMNGAACSADAECASEHCADGVCCNVACKGACNSCNLNGREGTCWPIDRGSPDPRGRCKDEGSATCGTNGTCDGFGACAKYARDVICVMPSCSAGNTLNTAGICNGNGTCQAPGVQDCHPFRCVNGACTNACQSDADCAVGIACNTTTNRCGPKQNGQVCTTAGECKSNQCVDGVCCESACTGGCRSCALPGSPGKCMAIAAGNDDSRGVCKDMGATTCGTTGKCDGSGGCQRYASGTVCAPEKCEVKVYTPPSTCNATGQCVTPDQQPCNPYLCNGTKCFSACTVNSQCQPPNSCVGNSCGKKPDGASCSAADECMHNFCEQGTCCATSCTGPCRSCALSGSLGTCTNVATGALDPAEMCSPQSTDTCGRNGRCQGGACQRYAAGTTCRAASCPTGTTLFTGMSSCDGAGTCVAPGATSCFPYLCGAGACKGTCTTNADCSAPASCIGGSCGLKPNGAVCVSGAECLSKICEQGVCCSTACGGTCKSCALPNARGTCTNVPTGDTDPHNNCVNMGPASCKTDGFCDGAGACRLYDAATSCAAPSCPSGQSTLTTGRTCDGKGTCQAASSIACAPYVCNGSTACKAACTSDADCLPSSSGSNICDPVTSRCGNKKRLGQACTSTNDCLTGNTCVDGVCCSTTSCPICKACNIAGSAGNCTNVPTNSPEPHALCAPNPPCGNTGACNGLGACLQAGTTVSCGTASCTGSTFTPISHCNGSGACAAPTASSCMPYVCGTGACKTACTADADCMAPFTCQGSGTTRSCALKPNGQACTAANQCISGNCLDGVCCGTATCGTCQACNINGMGSCAPYPAGTAAPTGQCTAAPPCGNTGTCNGAGACTQGSTSVQCAAPSCTGSTYTAAGVCTGAGMCGAQATSSCSPYVCNTNGTCRTTCSTNSDCVSSSFYCTGTGGTCQAKLANGATCTSANQCTSGNCIDGVCCGTATCGTCQACNIAGSLGTCANVAAGGSDPRGGCAANGTCGNTGTCNGSGACTQASSSTSCRTASCTGSTYTAAASCTGSGTCPAAVTSSCSPYVCGTGACKTSCNSDSDCISTAFYCTGAGGTCVSKKGNGTTCTAGAECSSGFCADGVCCASNGCGTCQACNLTGTLGTCTNVPAGTAAPRAGCAPSGTCGNTGLCNANGTCQQAANNVVCGVASCVGSAFTPAATCTGSGACSSPATVACTPFICGANNACLTTCLGDVDCASGYYCPASGAQCLAKKAAGAVCAVGHECSSGNCVDGVCCTTASCGTCQACNINGLGTCANVNNGTADARCSTSATCGNTGLCQGGACQQASMGTSCGTASCNANTGSFQPAPSCNGGGTCTTASAVSCAPYSCTTAGCRTSCTGDSDCSNGSICTAGSCVARRSNGTACTNDNQCTSGNCTDGVCCNMATCGTCRSCAVAGMEGTCTNLGPGTMHSGCMDDGAPTCGNNGRCDGAGMCEKYPATTVCDRACATDNSTYTVTLCDGLGFCNTPMSTSCPTLMCDAQTGCMN